MPVNRLALIRFKTIDNCLCNRLRRWTLDDLIEACSDALYEYEGKSDKIGKRTIQKDIYNMRSEKLGYNAPIIVIDRKYYTYEDPNYSITNIPLSKQDLSKLKEVTEVLKQFKGFSHFQDLGLMVQKLEDKVNSQISRQNPIIDFEKNDNLKGLDYLELLYNAILNKQVLDISYQSFKAQSPGKITLHPCLLKEYRNRWFVLGRKGYNQPILTLALDRIHKVAINETLNYIPDYSFDPGTYYKNVIGVTVSSARLVNVHLEVDKKHAPYIMTKPLHHSQQLISESDDGVEIAIQVIPNFELEKEILGFGESIKVLAPESLRKRIIQRITQSALNYNIK